MVYSKRDFFITLMYRMIWINFAKVFVVHIQVNMFTYATKFNLVKKINLLKSQEE